MTSHGFEAVALDTWWARVEKELGGKDPRRALCKRLLEGFEVEPVYTGPVEPARGAPGAAPWTRGSGVGGSQRNAPRHRHPDLQTVGAAIRHDAARGAHAAVIALDDPDSGGVGVRRAADVAALAEAAGEGWLLFEGDEPLSLAALVQAAGVTTPVWLGADPWGVLARDGRLSTSLETAEAHVMACVESFADAPPETRVLTLSTRAHHDAGASATDELAYAAAALVAAFRAAERHGVALESVASRTALAVSVGTDQFVEIAKLRALRAIWGRITAACGVDVAPRVHASTSRRALSRRDPWVNILRSTVATFAALCGGADVITSAPFDEPLGPPSEIGRRVARHTFTVLSAESHLAEVADPTGGAWYVERLTDRLAEEAWARFQAIERAGGLGACIASGRIRDEMEARWEARAGRLRTRKLPLTGVSEFATDDALLERPPWPQGPPPNEPPVPALEGDLMSAAVEAARAGSPRSALRAALAGAPGTAPALVRHRDAEDFERLRDAADTLPERPTVFLAALGPLAEHKPRVGFAGPFFAAGGVAVVAGDGTGDASPGDAARALAAALTASGTTLACLCGSDARYATHAVAAAKALREAGATRVFYAGRPANEDELRDAGVDGFLFLGADVIATLEPLLSEASS